VINMKAENRRKSMKKWARVLKLARAGRYRDAHSLAIAKCACGHCHEYSISFSCTSRCPLYAGYNDSCHDEVMKAIELLNEPVSTPVEAIRQIKRVQYLVMTDKVPKK
jgi:hypothetical protein